MPLFFFFHIILKMKFPYWFHLWYLCR